MVEARTIGTVVVAYPPNVDDDMLEPLRARLPHVEVVAAPYIGRLGRVRPGARLVQGDEHLDAWRRAEVVVAFDVPKELATHAPELRWIQGIGAGVDHYDGVEFPDGLVITNAAGVAAGGMAEFVIGRLLEVWKHFRVLDDQQGRREWKVRSGTLVEGKTVGIIGLGAIGSAVAQRLRAFGVHTIGTRRRFTPGQTHPAVDELFGADGLMAVLPRCDAVVVSVPGTVETENLFDADAFAAMKPGAVFCNVGRGSLVDEGALLAALESGALGAAILDVTRTEPLPDDDPLWAAPNLYLSPHCSTALEGYMDRLFDLVADNVGRYERGEELRNVVDLGAGY